MNPCHGRRARSCRSDRRLKDSVIGLRAIRSALSLPASSADARSMSVSPASISISTARFAGSKAAPTARREFPRCLPADPATGGSSGPVGGPQVFPVLRLGPGFSALLRRGSGGRPLTSTRIVAVGEPGYSQVRGGVPGQGWMPIWWSRSPSRRGLTGTRGPPRSCHGGHR
jgi:hypothetical protein